MADSQAARERARDLVAESVLKLRRDHPELNAVEAHVVLANQALIAIGAFHGTAQAAAEAAYCLADMLVVEEK